MRKSTENPQTVKRLSLANGTHFTDIYTFILPEIMSNLLHYFSLLLLGSCCACVTPRSTEPGAVPIPILSTARGHSHPPSPLHPPSGPQLLLLCINQKVNGCIFMTAPPSSSFIAVRLLRCFAFITQTFL